MTAHRQGETSLEEAARVLNRRPGTLREWLRQGLTARRPAFGRALARDRVPLDDLVSLEVIRRFVDAGVPLALVRVLEAALRQMFPDAPRPFAHRVFFLNGASVWLDLAADDPALLRFVEVRDGQPTWTGALGDLAGRLDHDEDGVISSCDLG